MEMQYHDSMWKSNGKSEETNQEWEKKIATSHLQHGS